MTDRRAPAGPERAGARRASNGDAAAGTEQIGAATQWALGAPPQVEATPASSSAQLGGQLGAD
jgi:hypothetical protein